MINDDRRPDDTLCAAIRMRLSEMHRIRRAISIRNLTISEIESAERLNQEAKFIRTQRHDGIIRGKSFWLKTVPQSEIFAWAMHRDCDVFADLLEGNSGQRTEERPRLPGVFEKDIEDRIDLVDDALRGRLDREMARKMKRERGW